MLVRPADEKDRKAIGIVMCRTWQQAYKDIVDQDYLDTLTPEGSEPKNINPEASFVCQIGEEIIGMVNFGISRQENDPTLGEIRAIYVLPERQGSGAGSLLFKAAQDKLQEKGFKKFALWVFEANLKSHDFYLKMGMVKTEKTKPYTIAGKDYPARYFEYIF